MGLRLLDLSATRFIALPVAPAVRLPIGLQLIEAGVVVIGFITVASGKNCHQSVMIMLTMWKIFIAFTLVTLRATFVAARLHSSNSLLLHASGGGGGSGGIGGLAGGSSTNKDAHGKFKTIF